jgi:hypothetical protein
MAGVWGLPVQGRSRDPECRGAGAEAPAHGAQAGRGADRELGSVAGGGRMGRGVGRRRRAGARQGKASARGGVGWLIDGTHEKIEAHFDISTGVES